LSAILVRLFLIPLYICLSSALMGFAFCGGVAGCACWAKEYTEAAATKTAARMMVEERFIFVSCFFILCALKIVVRCCFCRPLERRFEIARRLYAACLKPAP